jgi:hypothetical protein
MTWELSTPHQAYPDKRRRAFGEKPYGAGSFPVGHCDQQRRGISNRIPKMIKLFGQPTEEPSQRVELDPAFKTVALAAGALVLVLGVVFWRYVAFLLFVAWDSRPHPIVWLSLRSDTPYYGTPAWLRHAQQDFRPLERKSVLATRLANDGQALLLSRTSKVTEDDPETHQTRYSWTPNQ